MSNKSSNVEFISKLYFFRILSLVLLLMGLIATKLPQDDWSSDLLSATVTAMMLYSIVMSFKLEYPKKS